MKKILIGLVILVVIIALLMITGILKCNFSTRVGDKEKKADEASNKAVSSDQVKWKEYKSEKFGYKVSLPAAWVVDEKVSQSGGPEILISEPKKFGFVRIAAFYDKAINSPEAIANSINEYKKSLTSQKDTVVEKFETGKVENNVGGFIALGEFKISDLTFRFEERGLLSTNGRVLIFRAAGAKDKDVFNTLIPLMRKIMDSFKLE